MTKATAKWQLHNCPKCAEKLEESTQLDPDGSVVTTIWRCVCGWGRLIAGGAGQLSERLPNAAEAAE